MLTRPYNKSDDKISLKVLSYEVIITTKSDKDYYQMMIFTLSFSAIYNAMKDPSPVLSTSLTIGLY